jgi:hypothetical protein
VPRHRRMTSQGDCCDSAGGWACLDYVFQRERLCRPLRLGDAADPVITDPGGWPWPVGDRQLRDAWYGVVCRPGTG